MNTRRHEELIWFFAMALHSHTVTIARTRLFPAGANFAYISLNIPTPCPPRSAVPVNRPFFSQHRCWAFFGHKFGQVCDFPNDVRKRVSLLVWSLSLKNGSPRTPLHKAIEVQRSGLIPGLGELDEDGWQDNTFHRIPVRVSRGDDETASSISIYYRSRLQKFLVGQVVVLVGRTEHEGAGLCLPVSCRQAVLTGTRQPLQRLLQVQLKRFVGSTFSPCCW